MGPSWIQKPLCVPHFWLVGKRLQPPRPSLSSKGQIPTVANQGREGMQKQRGSSQEAIVQPWGRVLVPPQGLYQYITIPLSSSAGTKAPSQAEDGSFQLSTRFLEPRPGTSPPVVKFARLTALSTAPTLLGRH